MLPVDHLFFLLLAAVQPLHGAWSFRQYRAAIRAGKPPGRAAMYRNILILQWSAFCVLVAAWIWLGRPFAALGFDIRFGTGFVIAAGLVAALCGYLVYALWAARRFDSEARQKHTQALGDLQHFLPHSRDDYRRFVAVSLTAGVVEEVIYRGFLFWYLLHAMPLWAAIAMSAAIFGLAHNYQGAGGMLRVTLAGLAAGGLYALSGSIWLLIFTHAVVDVLQGAMIFEILRERVIDSGDSRVAAAGRTHS